MAFMFAAPLFRRPLRRTWPAGLLLVSALVVLLAQGCQVSVGDQSCIEGFNYYDKDDACPYGPPGGPKVKESACPDIPQETDPMKCTTSWADVYALFTGPSANCTNSGCHGSLPGARGIYLQDSDATAFYDELKAYTGSQGYPYFNEEDPAHSWVLCNLAGVPGGGSPMPPPSGFSDSDFAVIQKWAMCGLRRDSADAGP